MGVFWAEPLNPFLKPSVLMRRLERLAVSCRRKREELLELTIMFYWKIIEEHFPGDL